MSASEKNENVKYFSAASKAILLAWFQKWLKLFPEWSMDYRGIIMCDFLKIPKRFLIANYSCTGVDKSLSRGTIKA